MIEWGGEVVNSEADGQHTSTQMGSGHFPEEGFSKASYFRNIQVVDASNNLKAPKGIGTFTEQSNCYDVQTGNNGDWGHYFYYGGPGKNPNCAWRDKNPFYLPFLSISLYHSLCSLNDASLYSIPFYFLPFFLVWLSGYVVGKFWPFVFSLGNSLCNWLDVAQVSQSLKKQATVSPFVIYLFVYSSILEWLCYLIDEFECDSDLCLWAEHNVEKLKYCILREFVYRCVERGRTRMKIKNYFLSQMHVSGWDHDSTFWCGAPPFVKNTRTYHCFNLILPSKKYLLAAPFSSLSFSFLCFLKIIQLGHCFFKWAQVFLVFFLDYCFEKYLRTNFGYLNQLNGCSCQVGCLES